MDNKKYDDLDKLFRSRLKDDKIVQEDWNQAPRTAFDGAMSALDKKGRKKWRTVFWWIFSSILLAGFIYLTLSNFKTINRLENTIADLTTENQNSIINKEAEINLDITSTTEKEIVTDITTETANKNNQSGINEIIQSEINFSIQNINNQIPLPKEESENLEKTQRSKIVGIVSNENRTITPPAFLASIPIEIKKEEPSVIMTPSDTVKGILVQCCSFNPWQLYTLTGINASTIRMTNTEGADFSLTGYEQYYTDYFAGLGLEYQFHPKWSIDFQATYNRMHIKSTFEDEINYDKSLETIDNQGNVHYESDYDVFTIMGRQSGSLSLALGNKLIDDQDALMNQTLIDDSFQTVGLSLGSDYSLYCKNDWSFDIGLGVQYSHLLKVNEKMETSIYHENGLMLRESTEANPLKNANRNFWSLYGNIRAGYSFSDDFGLKLNVGTAHSLNSIRIANDENDSKTYINNLKVSIQAYYSF